jgi:hypothetical protein
MNKIVLSIITIGLIIGIGIIFLGSKGSDNTASKQAIQNVEVRDGIQYITIDAKGWLLSSNYLAQKQVFLQN